jgi:mlo protein
MLIISWSILSIGSLSVMIQMTGEIKLHGIGSNVHESVIGWLAERNRTGGDPDTDSGGKAEVTRWAPKERSGSSRNMLIAPTPPILNEIVTVHDVAVAATAVVGQGPKNS